MDQWNRISDEQQQAMIPWLLGSGNISSKHYSRYFTMGKMIELVRKNYQIDIYTVNKYWCVQLFDFDVAANDQTDCIWEGDSLELVDILFEAVLWIMNKRAE